MKFGVVLPSFGPQAARLPMLDTTFAAERLGFHSVWVTDHIALPEADAGRFGTIFESITTLAYLAASTERIRLGISSLVLPQRNPIEVAKQLATVDVLSGGRVIVATGVGWSEGEFKALGHSFKDRGKRMDEAVQVLRTLWRGGRLVSYKGKYYHFEKVVFSPPTIQSGGPELWIAGDSRAALRRAAFFADGWHPNASSPEEIERLLKSASALLGKRAFTVSVRLRIALNRSPETERSLSGSPEQVAERLRAYQQAGMTYAVLYFEADSQGEREQAMTAFAQEVAPSFS